jgi:RHS repeat-associated protein
MTIYLFETYNELGELVTKYLHSESAEVGAEKDFVQKVDYSYNIRGWLTAINDPELDDGDNDIFGMNLYYNSLDESDIDQSNISLQYNGNIAAMVWGLKYDTISGYSFTYDKINRLTSASYGQGLSLDYAGDYDVGNITYDANGNIQTLQRTFEGIRVDDLTYNYLNEGLSNQLGSVTEAGVNNHDGVADFYVTDADSSYQYDNNGNMIYDPGKGNEISYNYLNLPEKISFGNNQYIYYHYDAAGNKLAKVIESNGSEDDNKTEYIAGLIYINDALNSIPNEEGRVVPIVVDNDTTWHYEYNLKDHLGNTQAIFGGSYNDGNVDVVQTTNYYPFGMVLAQNNYYTSGTNYEQNKYLYNGKELQDDELGGVSLDWYDYGARFYDASLGRFGTIDPLCEFMPYSSPYAYAGNNPISYIDYNGEHPVIIIGGIGLVEFGLISTGVIVSGWFLTRDHHGRITLGDDLRDFFPRSRNNKKRDKRRNNHRKEMKAKNHTMSKGDGNMMGYQPEGDWRQTFTAAGMFAGTVIKTFDFWRYNKETINYYHDEFKTENLDSYYSELTSPNLRLVGGVSNQVVILF